MAKRNFSQPTGSRSYRQFYSTFRGVDFSNNPLLVDPSRSPSSVNCVVDEAGIVHKRPGWAAIMDNSLEANINGIYLYEPSKAPAGYTANHFRVIHMGKAFILDNGVNGSVGVIGGTDAPSAAFQHNDRLYIMDGTHFHALYFDDALNGWALKKVYEIATAPETQIAGYYMAEETKDDNDQPIIKYTWQFGEKGERNILTGRRKNTFCGDAHNKVFYFDTPNFKAYKVEMYSPSAAPSSTEGTVTAVTGTSNVRNKPSMQSTVIGYATGGQTFTVLGKTGSWYKIVFGNGTQDAYINQSRVTYTPASGGSTPTAADDWVEIASNDATYGWSTAEVGSGGEHPASNLDVTVSNCTKITFTTAPPAHPRGNGLPNIRVTGAVTETTTYSHTFTHDEVTYDTPNVTIPEDSMMTQILNIKKNGTIMDSGYTITLSGAHTADITFTSMSEGDTVEVAYRRESFKDVNLIEGCNKYGKYGSYNTDRWFYTGNTDHINRDWYTEPSDPTLVLENSYTDIGNTQTPIAGYLNMQSDMLIVKYDSNGENLFRRSSSSDGDMTIFPVKAYVGRGAVNPKALCNIKGDCVFLSPDGVYKFVSSDLGTRYSVQEMSLLINKRLKQEDMSCAEMEAWGNYLILSFYNNGHCYVADTSNATAPSTTGGYGYEWFYWEHFPAENLVFDNYGGLIYFSIHKGKICTFPTNDYADYPDGISEAGVPIDAIWSTAQDTLYEPAEYKHIERRGAIIHLLPMYQGLQMAVVTDGNFIIDSREDEIDPDFFTVTGEELTEIRASRETPYIVINRRIPRFKYIQFVFRNNDPDTDGIGVISVEYQYRYGRYIKV